MTFSFTGFPNLPHNTVTENILVNGEKVYKQKFSFNGPFGSNTVPLSLAPGSYKIQAYATWNTNEVKGESATAATEVECT